MQQAKTIRLFYKVFPNLAERKDSDGQIEKGFETRGVRSRHLNHDQSGAEVGEFAGTVQRTVRPLHANPRANLSNAILTLTQEQKQTTLNQTLWLNVYF